jgi:hypothetical protein
MGLLGIIPRKACSYGGMCRQSIRKEIYMCPFTLSQASAASADILCFGVKVFLLIWIVFVPIAITARLEKIIKLLDDEGK